MARRLMSKIVPEKEKFKEETKIDTKAIIRKIQDGYEIKKGMTFKKRVGFTPSGLTYGAGKCARMWYLWFEGNEAENTNDWYSVANMDSGTDRHIRIQDAMENAGILIDREYHLKTENPIISGKTDAIISFDGIEILTEIKTVNNDAYERILKPRSYHIEQLLIYMKIMKKAFAFLIYENKNTHDIKFFPVNLNDKYKEFMKYLYNWMNMTQKAFDDKQLPENPFRNKYENKICKGCDFFKVCQTKPVGDIKIEPRKDLG
jgi:CRISPR/Cas system-associated exonuclease Cas4 (RecB family)